MSRTTADIERRRKTDSPAYPQTPSFLDRSSSARPTSSRTSSQTSYRPARAAKGLSTPIFDFNALSDSEVRMPSWLDDGARSTARPSRPASAGYRSAGTASAKRPTSSYAAGKSSSYQPSRTARPMRAGGTDRQAPAAREDQDTARRPSARKQESALQERFERNRHDRRHKKADREFAKNVVADPKPASEAGPRPGLYKGEMGRTHKKSARMQAQASPAAGTKAARFPRFSLSAWRESSHFLPSVAVVLCIVLAVGFIYPAAKDAYTSLRQKDQMAAEYQAIQDRNDEIQDRIDTLSAPAGMEDLAHTDYGWVKSGEKSVSVSREGSSTITADATSQTAAIASGSVPAPTTWYSPVLDVLFGYSS